MTLWRNATCRWSYELSLGLSFVLAVSSALGGCVAEEPAEGPIEDLGEIGDDKSDTALPRTIELELEPGAQKRYRITTAAFVASVAQSGNVDAQLTAKHYEFEFDSGVSRAPHLVATADGTARNWSLTVYNRGDATLAADVVVDIPRDTTELGIVSDIDKTVLPPEVDGEMPAPYPGVGALLRMFELRQGGRAGDLHYVTARAPEGVVEIPDWMASHAVPAGSIDTGISGVPWIAQAEKVRDISRIIDGRVQQTFVLLGDTAHRDPEVYREIQGKYAPQIAEVFIHKVNATVPPARVEGMHLVNNYAEAAAIAFGKGLLDEVEAREVMEAAQSEGLAITNAEIDALLDAQR